MTSLTDRLAEAAFLSARTARAILRLAADPARLAGAVRKTRGTLRNGGLRALLDAIRERAGTDRAYLEWITRFEKPSLKQLARLRIRAEATSPQPLVSVLLTAPEGASRALMQRSLESVHQQLYPHSEVCAAMEASRGDILVPLRAGDALARTALLAFAEAFASDPDTDVVYGDFDRLAPDGTRHSPCFKPDWDPELIAWPEYVGVSAAFSARLFPARRARNTAELAAGATRVRHLPHLLCHSSRASETGELPRAAPAVRPLVSAIVPTRDGGETLRRCVDGLRHRTDYPALELLIVDNGSREDGTLSLLRELTAKGQARVLRDDRPFNYSALNNAAAAVARGSVLLLLNDDVQALDPGWLDELVALAQRPGVGPVGAKLLYPDGTIQHAGIVTGLFGVVGHVSRGLPSDGGWPCDRPRTVSAVTGAALAIRRELYELLGGLDEELAVAFNDVDFCLRAERAGCRTLYTPRAVLVHHESRTRGRDDTPEKRARFARETAFLQQRWGDRLLDDPYYSPNLSLYSETAQLAWPPRTSRLWE